MITTTVAGCARCGQTHEGVEFREFIGRPFIDCDNSIWTHWAQCPTNHEPILMRITYASNPSAVTHIMPIGPSEVKEGNEAHHGI